MIKQIFAAIVLLSTSLFAQSQGAPAFRPYDNPYCDIVNVPPQTTVYCPNGSDEQCVQACRQAYIDELDEIASQYCDTYSLAYSNYITGYSNAMNAYIGCMLAASGPVQRFACLVARNIALWDVTDFFDSSTNGLATLWASSVDYATISYWACLHQCCLGGEQVSLVTSPQDGPVPGYQWNMNPYCKLGPGFQVPRGPFTCIVDQACLTACRKSYFDGMAEAAADACAAYEASHDLYDQEFDNVSTRSNDCMSRAQTEIDRASCRADKASSYRVITHAFKYRTAIIANTYSVAVNKLVSDYWTCVSKCCIDKFVIVPDISTAGISVAQLLETVGESKIWKF